MRWSAARPCLLAAVLVGGCRERPAPRAPGGTSSGIDAPAPAASSSTFPAKLDPTYALGGVARYTPLVVVGPDLYAVEDGPPAWERLFRTDADHAGRREVVLEGRNIRVQEAGSSVLASADGERGREAFLVGRARGARSLGPAADETWDSEGARAIVVRPPGDDRSVDVVGVPDGDATRAETIATVRDPSLGTDPRGLAACSRGVFVGFEDVSPVAPNLRQRGSVLFVASGEHSARRLFHVDLLGRLHVVGSTLLVSALAHLFRYDIDAGTPPELVEGIFWDTAAFDGDVVYYSYQTLLPVAGIGARTFAWRVGGAPREIIGGPGPPDAIAVDREHVYFLDGSTHEVRRMRRLRGF